MCTHPIYRGGNLLRVICLAYGCCLLPFLSWAEGIPEPPLIWYGVVRNNAGGQNVRLTTGTLTWTLRYEGGATAKVLTVPLTNLLDQFSFVVELPCEGEVGGSASPDALRLTDPPIHYDRASVTLNSDPVFLASPQLETFSLDPASRGQIERLDLSIVRIDPDTDGDGLPDWWESQFPDGDVPPDADFDGDGVRNVDEYRAGTNPLDPASLFQISITTDELGYPIVRWGSAPAKTYRLFRSDSVTTPRSEFREVQRNIGATPPWNGFLDWSATGSGPYFYLLQIEE